MNDKSQLEATSSAGLASLVTYLRKHMGEWKGSRRWSTHSAIRYKLEPHGMGYYLHAATSWANWYERDADGKKIRKYEPVVRIELGSNGDPLHFEVRKDCSKAFTIWNARNVYNTLYPLFAYAKGTATSNSYLTIDRYKLPPYVYADTNSTAVYSPKRVWLLYVWGKLDEGRRFEFMIAPQGDSYVRINDDLSLEYVGPAPRIRIARCDFRKARHNSKARTAVEQSLYGSAKSMSVDLHDFMKEVRQHAPKLETLDELQELLDTEDPAAHAVEAVSMVRVKYTRSRKIMEKLSAAPTVGSYVPVPTVERTAPVNPEDYIEVSSWEEINGFAQHA